MIKNSYTTMKISVIMIDGGFRENPYSADYFTTQQFPDTEYEVLWVEYYDKAHARVLEIPKIKVITLNRSGTYHSSYCFNRGIIEAQGEVIVIPDADQIVPPDFLTRVWEIHAQYEKLVVYGYRYDELQKGLLRSHSFEELESKCVLFNPVNYGGCLTIRRKWLVELNGYEQHPVFRTGFHANGLDMYTRLKNYGLAIQWYPSLKLYHPWHPSTLIYSEEQKKQEALINWRKKYLQWRTFDGIDSTRNERLSPELKRMVENISRKIDTRPVPEKISIKNLLKKSFNRLGFDIQRMKR
jgi:hypothetical protein